MRWEYVALIVLLVVRVSTAYWKEKHANVIKKS
jgi:hypothetical protein